MINILILEDTQSDFEIILNYIFSLNKEGGMNIYPNIDSKGENYFEVNSYGTDWHYIQETFEKKYSSGASHINDFFKEIIDVYEGVNIYIVDINLINLEDRLGIKFLEYLDKNTKTEAHKHYIIISTDTYAGEINIDENKYSFISKYNSISNIKNELIYRVSRIIEKI
ncbi:hypothetical protein [Kordia sp.]|uniref:hypothetical protein n=1 Tax=Kordia sp. TaxID=1965332 RepID=UPI003D277ADB